MAITIAQQKVFSGTSTSQVSGTFTNPTVNGNGIVVEIGSTHVVNSVTDDASNTYTQRRTNNFFSGTYSHIYDCVNISNNPTTIHVNVGATSTQVSAVAYEVNGTLTAKAGSSNNANTTGIAPGAISTTDANTIWFLVEHDSGTGGYTQPSGWTLDENDGNGGGGTQFLHQVFTTTQTSVNPTPTNNSGGASACLEAYTSTNNGSTVYNKSISESLTFTETQTTQNILVRSISESLTFTETQTEAHLAQGAVVQSLTFIETQTTQNNLVRTVPQSLAFVGNPSTKGSLYNVSVSQTLTLVETQVGVANKLGIASSTLVLSQTVDPSGTIHNTSLSQGLGISGNLPSVQTILNLNVPETLTFVSSGFPTPGSVYARHPTDPVTFVQTIGLNYTLGKSVSEVLTLTETQTVEADFVRSVSEPLVFIETVSSAGSIYNLSVSQTLTLSQLTEHSTFQELSQSFTLSQTQTNVVDHHRSVVSTIHLLSSPGHGTFTKAVSAFHAIGFNQFQKATKVFTESVATTFALSQEVAREVHLETVVQVLTLTQTLSPSNVTEPLIAEVLNLSQTIQIAKQTNVNVSSVLTFLPTHNRFLADISFTVPNIQNVLITGHPCTILSGPSQIVVLPNPQFGDGQGNTGEFTVRFAINGKAYTYVKNNNTTKLNYSFWLSRSKCRELQRFLQTYQASLVQLQNWKGEVWQVYITNNPFEAHGVQSYGPGLNEERWDISLEFEGIRMN